MRNSKELKFTAPEGLDLAGKEEGDTIEVVAELRIEAGGKLCLESINGIPTHSIKEEEEPDERASMGARVMDRAMSA